MSANVTNSIPATLNDLLVKLRILSMIERGKKINMGSMTFVESSSWWGSFSRSLSGEGRKGLMVHLNQIVQQAITAISEYKDTEFCGLIVNKLAQAKIGIQNLSTTYQEDPSIVAQIDICVSNINLQLEKNRSLLEGHQHIGLNGLNRTQPVDLVRTSSFNLPASHDAIGCRSSLSIPISTSREQPAFGINGVLRGASAPVPVSSVGSLGPDIGSL